MYSLNSCHFSVSCCGRFLVLPPLTFVGLHGQQKYLISALPVLSFCASAGIPSAAPSSFRLGGEAKYKPYTIVQRHRCAQLAGLRCRYLDKQYHSKAALCAHSSVSGSSSATRTFCGSAPVAVKSTTCTSSSSPNEYANSRISKSGDCAYLYSPALPISTLE